MSTPTREQFVHQVLELVTRRFPLVKIVRADQPFSMRVNGHVVPLENLYRMAVLQPDHLRRHVERWVVELIRAAENPQGIEGAFDELKDRVMPMIVPQTRDERVKLVTQPLVGNLVVAYAIDNDRTISYLTSPVIRKWGISVEDLHATAMENLAQHSQALSAHAAQDDDERVYLILFQTMDGYDSSRILLPNLHERLRGHLGSPFAAAIPNRDILLCFRNEEDTIARLAPQIQGDFAQMPHQITDKILLVTADGIAQRA